MSVKVPDYITIEDYRFSKDVFNEKVLPAGTFVKPIYHQYLPAHVKSSTDYEWFNSEQDMFVYCNFGIICIPKKIVRKT